MRAWIGTSLLTVVGIGLSIVALWRDFPWWVSIAIILLTLTALVLSWPVSVEAERGSATFRGDVVRSSIVNVRSEADTFIDGQTRESLLMHIVHAPQRRR